MSMSKYASKADYEKAQRDATQYEQCLEHPLRMLRNATMRVGSFGNMNIEVVRRDEAEAILRDALRPAVIASLVSSETATTTNAAPQSAPSAGIHSGEDLPSAVAAPSDACRQELENIVKAKRFDREVFQDDSEFANLVVSRCRHALSSPSAIATPEWLIWSSEQGAWWGKDRAGYYTDPSSAGRYTLDQARSICRVRSWENGVPPETMIHEGDIK